VSVGGASTLVKVIVPLAVMAVNVAAAGVPVPMALGEAQFTTELLSNPLVSCGMSLPELPTV